MGTPSCCLGMPRHRGPPLTGNGYPRTSRRPSIQSPTPPKQQILGSSPIAARQARPPPTLDTSTGGGPSCQAARCLRSAGSPLPKPCRCLADRAAAADKASPSALHPPRSPLQTGPSINKDSSALCRRKLDRQKVPGSSGPCLHFWLQPSTALSEPRGSRERDKSESGDRGRGRAGGRRNSQKGLLHPPLPRGILHPPRRSRRRAGCPPQMDAHPPGADGAAQLPEGCAGGSDGDDGQGTFGTASHRQRRRCCRPGPRPAPRCASLPGGAEAGLIACICASIWLAAGKHRRLIPQHFKTTRCSEAEDAQGDAPGRRKGSCWPGSPPPKGPPRGVEMCRVPGNSQPGASPPSSPQGTSELLGLVPRQVGDAEVPQAPPSQRTGTRL